jgi:drug/metabolite transporter (DMT)-like permease
MGVLLAVLAAAVYGTGDFYGGLATKRTSSSTVVATSGMVGLIVVLAAAPIVSTGPIPRNDLIVGAIAGAISPVALGALYRGLAVGRMSVVAPITAVIAAVVPVAFGFLKGERPSVIVWAGILLAIVAVALISSSSHEDVAGVMEPAGRGIGEAAIAGIGFGALYVLLSQTSHGLWPLVAMRSVSVPLAIAFTVAARHRLLPPACAAVSLLAAGVFDMGANILYVVSLRFTLISIAAVVTSLYPASTVLLARLILNERLVMVQWAGVVCAFVGIAMIALG